MTHLEQIRKLNIRPYLQRSNVAAWQFVVVNYGLIAFALALPALWAAWPSYLISLVLLGNRQLGLGILMHDCAHHALFLSKQLNQWVGRWLCAAPIWAQFDGYQTYHLQHHANAGTTKDPDYINYRNYPVSRFGLVRKIARDCFAITGIKNFALVMLMHAGIVNYDMAYKSVERKSLSWQQVAVNLIRNLHRPIVCHFVLFSFCFAMGSVLSYALWWVAYFTTFSLFSRIRNAAEHASVPDLLDVDPRRHARTVKAGVLARLTVAPNHVNYHIEHHWLPQVPPYRLAALHDYLQRERALEGAEILPNYFAVIRKLA
ncbi:fatty acid desaturase family protein [Alteromonas sp. ASW11-36]|uniref:Fatty acid desaturase family protein n=1 Tax=Alteromonas arenosi TaxID=3055817 RepID=A0ABT7SY12_9ALTE|nr:fatty acid desaturase family protein [Alteromonas sp. ASW11-36]MDM7861078.1 fatty acid desaturase family protein [Alteromonas sp. ASW11-36]